MTGVTHRDVDVSDGLRLHVTIAGRGAPLVMLHGFTGSGETWAALRTSLGADLTTIAVDQPGHGGSTAPADPARYALTRFADDLVRLFDVLGVQRAAVLGYSMGGRAALHFAHRHPARVSALVLESASPGISDAGERAARITADAELADSIERDGVEAFVARWEALPIWASQRTMPAHVRAMLRAQRLTNEPRGLANSLRGAGAAAETSLESSLPRIAVPTLLVAGEMDAKYVAIAHACAAAMPDARAEIVSGAGHAVHLEQPERFAEVVREFLGASD